MHQSFPCNPVFPARELIDDGSVPAAVTLSGMSPHGNQGGV